jgi:hypothetical protein
MLRAVPRLEDSEYLGVSTAVFNSALTTISSLHRSAFLIHTTSLLLIYLLIIK